MFNKPITIQYLNYFNFKFHSNSQLNTKILITNHLLYAHIVNPSFRKTNILFKTFVIILTFFSLLLKYFYFIVFKIFNFFIMKILN